MEQEVAQLKAIYESAVARRKKMQEKLKEFYLEQQKRNQVPYRNQPASTTSSFSIDSRSSHRSTPYNYADRPKTHQISMASASTRDSSFFQSNSPKMRPSHIKMPRTTESTLASMPSQSSSNRKPFFG